MSQVTRNKASKTLPPYKARRQAREASALARFYAEQLRDRWADLVEHAHQHNLAIGVSEREPERLIH